MSKTTPNKTTVLAKSVTPFSTQPKLTRKQKAFVDYVIAHPKDSYTEAAAQTYSIAKRNTARSVATENLTKPAIQSALSSHVELVESAISKTVTDWKDENNSRKREIAMQNAQWIHDKIFGKSKQQLDISSTSVTLSLDLTGLNQPEPEE